MNYWLKARRDPGAWALTIAGTVLIPLIGAYAMPVLRLGFGPAPFSAVLPALLATGIMGVVRGGSPVHEALSRRPTGLLTRLMVLGLLVVPAICWATAAVLTSQPDLTLTALRNLAGYLGVGLITLRVIGGTAANAAPVLYAVVVAVLGSRTAGTWSWPLHALTDGSALVVAVALFLVGLAVGVGTEALRSQALRAE